MEKLLRYKKRSLILFIISLALIFGGTPLLAITAVRGIYPLAAVMILAVGYGFYSFPFYLRAMRRARTMLALATALSEGVTDGTEIAERTGLTECGVEFFTELMKQKEYI